MERIGRYEILGELGRGAMGVVYRARDPSIGRPVAIKTIRLDLFPDPAERARLRERFLREAQSAGVLSHPNIVTIYDVGEQDGLAYIAMEFVDGPTLAELIRSQSLTRELLLEVLKQTAAGLDYAHKRGVVHRDIKPANIILHEGATPKIADFGVARLQSEQMTQAGLILGTIHYMAPEQLQSTAVDGRADQFSLAVIAYELLTGEKPFAADSVPALMFRVVNEAPTPPQRLNPTLTWPVEQVLTRALSKDPDQRFPSCSEFVSALEKALQTARDWRPVPVDAALTLPTVVETAAQSTVLAHPQPAPHAPSPAPSSPAPTEQNSSPAGGKASARSPSRVLRLLRFAAVFCLVLGALVLLIDLTQDHWPASQSEPSPQGPLSVSVPQPAPPPPTQPDLAVSKPPDEPAQTASPTSSPSPPAGPAPSAPLALPKTKTSPAHQRKAQTPSLPEIAPVRFVSVPPGAQVKLDTGQSCQAPCTLELPRGRHTLSAALEGYRPAFRIFEAPAPEDVTIVLSKALGTVAIRSSPSGATIILNGVTRQERTPAMLSLPAGHYRLEIVKDGFAPHVDEIDVRDSVLTNIEVQLSTRT
jgi:serine/threonine-protein kinase